MHHKNTTSESDMNDLISLDSQFFTYVGNVEKSQACFHATPLENHQGKMEATHQILHQQKMPPSMHTSTKAKDIQRIQSKLISISSWMLILFTIDSKKAQMVQNTWSHLVLRSVASVEVCQRSMRSQPKQFLQRWSAVGIEPGDPLNAHFCDKW